MRQPESRNLSPLEHTCVKLPLIIDDHGDVSIFRDKETAEMQLEALDVIDGAYVGFDAEGHSLRFRAKHWYGPVRIEIDYASADEASLRAALYRFLAANRVPATQYANGSVDLLVSMALSYLTR